MPIARVNGVNLSYEIRGQGPPIVLTYGFQSSVFTWRPILDFFTKRFQVITWDLRGHGDSEKPPGPYRVQDFSDDLCGLLDALGLDRVDLLGRSMGGRTATLFAIEHGERLGRLMLVGASAGPPSGVYRERFESNLRMAREKGIEAVLEHRFKNALVPRKILKEPLAGEYRAHFLKNTPETYASTTNALFTMPDLRVRLSGISAPTWICYGENDAGPLDFSDIYLERIPGSTRSIIPDAGHFPEWDNTEVFLEELDRFLKKDLTS